MQQQTSLNGSARRSEIFTARDVESYSSAVSHVFKPVRVSSDHNERFHGRFRSYAVSNLVMSNAVANQHHIERTAELVGSDRTDAIMFNLQQSGIGRIHQNGREAVLFPGDIAIYDADSPYSIDLDDSFRMVVIMCPRASLDLSGKQVTELAAVNIPGRDGMTQMISPLLGQISGNLNLLYGFGGVRLAHNMLDLISTALHGYLGTTAVDPRRVRRSFLLEEIKAYVDDHLEDPELCPAKIASSVFISTRHLHDIFSAEGVTTSTWIRQRRLERCRRDLENPANVGLPVSAIAARWGFTDPPHFSRLFKKTYGQTPSDFRALSS